MKVIQTPSGYFTVFGWDFTANMGRACALPFPNDLGISITKAKEWLKKEKIPYFVVTVDGE